MKKIIYHRKDSQLLLGQAIHLPNQLQPHLNHYVFILHILVDSPYSDIILVLDNYRFSYFTH